MGSGKTIIAEQLAKKMNINMVEMDWVILQSAGFRDMDELFSKSGEITLREWEINVARDWRDLDNAVIATGGGVVMNKISIDYLKENGGKVIFLDTPFDLLAKRIEKDSVPRPLFKNLDEAKSLYEFRLPLYKKYADIVIETDKKSIEEIVESIVKHI